MSEIEIQAAVGNEKLILELESNSANENGDSIQLRSSASGQVVLRTTTANFSKSARLHTIDRHFWSGRALTNFPALHQGYYAVPSQQGTLPQGVKWGIVYADGDDTTARKWVAAFDTATGQAYAEAGPIGPVDWNVIEVKLGMSGNKSEYTDPALGGTTSAEINGLNARAIFRN
ncbi:hypothetical protein SOVF_036710 [Spinacia oleracea]|uniref:Uncharacterized protein n=1 Tax=Spinacia oleracea TaxID=3562 RepID=A0ABM3RDY5_SPIOL|nr:uncharacterized protein LOC110777716 [Spinacia oleracea]KNA22148.1 hypothetical protein SOVF_036710 [Spinacia oleracea]